MAIEPKLRQDIANFLIERPELGSEGGRRTLLYAAGLDKVLSTLDLHGSQQEFVITLIQHCDVYGTVDETTPALMRLLRHIKGHVGLDKQQIIDHLCEQVFTSYQSSQSVNTQSQKITCINICHKSLEYFPNPVKFDNEGNNITITIDQTDYYSNGSLTTPHLAAQKQANVPAKLAALLEKNPAVPIHYYGLAHIPLLFLLGYQLADKFPITFFEYDRHNKTWDLLEGIDVGQELKLEGNSRFGTKDHGEIILRISVSYEIPESDTKQIIPSPIESLHLRIDRPGLDTVKSREQIRLYTMVFRKILDEIHVKIPNAQKLHIFYAGSVALAVEFGRKISPRIDPEVIVYNYENKNPIKYLWGLKMTTAFNSDDFLVIHNLKQ